MGIYVVGLREVLSNRSKGAAGSRDANGSTQGTSEDEKKGINILGQFPSLAVLVRHVPVE